MAETTLTIQGKILKVLAYILLGAGLVFLILGFQSIFMGMAPPFLDFGTLLVFGFALLLAGSFLLVIAQQGILKPEFTTISLIKCTNTPECKYRKVRKFEKDDYVFKELDETCEKCFSKLYIAGILEVERKAKQKKSIEEKSEETLKQLEPTPEPEEKEKGKKTKKKEETTF